MPLKEKQVIQHVFPDKINFHAEIEHFDNKNPLVPKIDEVLAGQIIIKAQLKKVIELLTNGNNASNERIGKKLDAMIKDVKSTV